MNKNTVMFGVMDVTYGGRNGWITYRSGVHQDRSNGCAAGTCLSKDPSNFGMLFIL